MNCMRKSFVHWSFLGLLTVVAMGSEAKAALVLVTDRASLGSTDFVDWGNAGSKFALVGAPLSISSNGSVNVIADLPNSDGRGFQRLDQSPDSSASWSGNFAPGDHLIWTRGSNQNFINPIDLSGFNGTGILAGGTQIQPNGLGSYTAKIEAFDVNGVSLGSFTRTGNSTQGHDNSAIFLGVRSDQAPIARLQISLVSSPGARGDFAINQFDFEAVPVGTAVPEPSTLALLGIGIAGLATCAWRRRVRPV